MSLRRFSGGLLKLLQQKKDKAGKGNEDAKEKVRTDRLTRMPSCLAHTDTAESCNYHRTLEGQHRCSAASFMKVDCPYLGPVLPHPDEIQEKKKQKKNSRLHYRPPPEV